MEFEKKKLKKHGMVYKSEDKILKNKYKIIIKVIKIYKLWGF